MLSKQSNSKEFERFWGLGSQNNHKAAFVLAVEDLSQKGH
tara:strand:+ start:5552 stop:5671 length:120 start_codon:yes stop_codon:yes gene_type:complete